jgi:4-diphosphocytidyl-2-C-methyl-D-erythritol kinase
VRQAPAKINLALVVGPTRADGKHEVATVYQRIDLADDVALEEAPAGTPPGVEVAGFPEDTLVMRALEAVAAAAGAAPAWRARLEKRIPVAAGLGGGSSDAAAALLLANDALGGAVAPAELRRIAAALGADVPFFLTEQPCLGTGDGSELAPLPGLPLDYAVLLLRPSGAVKPSTGAIYAAFDDRDGPRGWDDRSAALATTLARVRVPRDLAALPANDLASSPLAARLLAEGAFRADVTGAGPLVYGLFDDGAAASAAAARLASLGETWTCRPTC